MPSNSLSRPVVGGTTRTVPLGQSAPGGRWRALVGVALALGAGLASARPALGISAASTLVTIAGTGAAVDGGDGDQATEAQIRLPRSVFLTADGGYLVAEPYSNVIRKVGGDGRVSTVAGTGAKGFAGDGGPATAATLNFVHSAAPMPDGGFLIADTLNHRIRRVAPDGTISTAAGSGRQGFSGDGGPATVAAINTPRGVVALADGSFLIPDSDNFRVRKVSPAGIITTVAGTGVRGFSGDGGPATLARLARIYGVAPTADGGFLVVDTGNQRIRRVAANGTMSTVAGNGMAGYGGDEGPATAAALSTPHNVVALSDGSFLIADTLNARVRLVAATGTITTLAGNGVKAFGGDGGPAAAASLNAPKAVAISAAGNVLIADESNNRIRFVGTPVAPANTSPPTIAGTAAQGQTLTASAGGWSGTGPVMAYQWRRCDPSGVACADVAGATAKTYLVGAADVGSTIRVVVTGSNAAGSATAVSGRTTVVPDDPPPPPDPSSSTFSVALSADDGTVQASGPTGAGYPPGNAPAARTNATTIVAGRSNDLGNYTVSMAVLRFDTSAIPDGATVTSATLRVWVTARTDADGRNLVAEWYDPAAWPIDASDYAVTSSASALSGADLTAVLRNASNDFLLQGVSSVSTTGFTALRVAVDGGQPQRANSMELAAADSPSLPEPQLVVTYTTSP